MIANILKSALLLGTSYLASKQISDYVVDNYSEEIKNLQNRRRASKQARYYTALSTKGLLSTTALDKQVQATFDLLSGQRVEGIYSTHAFAGAVAPFDGLTETSIIEGVQYDGGHLVVSINGKELFSGKHSKYNVIELCEELMKQHGSFIVSYRKNPLASKA